MLIREARLFQLGYVLADLDAARTTTLPGMGFSHVHMIRGGETRDGDRRIALAYAGEMMFEFIEPGDAPEGMYRHVLGGPPAIPVLHHLGYLVDATGWESVNRQLPATGLRLDRHGSHGDRMDYMYIDARPLCGSYLEYVHLKSAGIDMFRDVPHF